MKIILDDGTEVTINGDEKSWQTLLTNFEAMIEHNEKVLGCVERAAEAIRKRIFTLRRVYDALTEVRDATLRVAGQLSDGKEGFDA